MTLSEGREKLASAMLRPINPAAVVLLGIYTVVWGFWVANPFWKVFSQAELYGVLAQVAPEWVWGLIAITCGTITCYGAIKRSYKPLVRGAVVAGWHWMMISIFYFMGDPLNTGGITALTFAVYAAFVFLNLRVNYRENKKSREILR